MITIYPMLVSRTVSENIVPGITKAIESYIIVYSMDDIMTNPWGPKNFNYKIKGGKVHVNINEGENIYEQRPTPPGTQPGTKGKTKNIEDMTPDELKDYHKQVKQDISDLERSKKQMQKQAAIEKAKEQLKKKQTQLTKAEKELDKRKEEAKTASAKITASDYRAIQLEPSYITVEVRKGEISTTEFVGVKVVPMRVKSDARLSDMMQYDRQMKMLRATLVSFGRKVLRGLYRFLNKWISRLPFASDFNIMTGDPRKDIILSRSGFAGETFVVLQLDDLDEDFFSSPRNINRLFRLGWGNIIIADDVNRVVYFCMKKFRGICSSMSYAMLYQTFGQAKVYESLEDAKRQNSSLFKLGPKLTKLASEFFVSSKLNKYSSLNEDK